MIPTNVQSVFLVSILGTSIWRPARTTRDRPWLVSRRWPTTPYLKHQPFASGAFLRPPPGVGFRAEHWTGYRIDSTPAKKPTTACLISRTPRVQHTVPGAGRPPNLIGPRGTGTLWKLTLGLGKSEIFCS